MKRLSKVLLAGAFALTVFAPIGASASVDDGTFTRCPHTPNIGCY